MKLSPQAQTVLRHLRSEPHITGWIAEGLYKIRRLASRVDELVAAGFDILKEECRDATGQRYIRYSLSELQLKSDRPLHPPREREPRVTLALIRNVMDDLGFYEEDINELIDAIKEQA